MWYFKQGERLCRYVRSAAGGAGGGEDAQRQSDKSGPSLKTITAPVWFQCSMICTCRTTPFQPNTPASKSQSRAEHSQVWAGQNLFRTLQNCRTVQTLSVQTVQTGLAVSSLKVILLRHFPKLKTILIDPQRSIQPSSRPSCGFQLLQSLTSLAEATLVTCLVMASVTSC